MTEAIRRGEGGDAFPRQGADARMQNGFEPTAADGVGKDLFTQTVSPQATVGLQAIRTESHDDFRQRGSAGSTSSRASRSVSTTGTPKRAKRSLTAVLRCQYRLSNRSPTLLQSQPVQIRLIKRLAPQ